MGKVSGTLVFDIESHSANRLYDMPTDEFTRLIGYNWVGQDDVVLTTSRQELIDQILKARWIVGHNIHYFDLKAVFGPDSDIPLELAMEGRVLDTWTHAVLVHPAPLSYTDRNGKAARAEKPEQLMKWFGLDEQAHQLGVAGKTGDLRAMARKWGPDHLKGEERIEEGFGLIPVDDEEYREYLRGDVIASRGVARELLKLGPMDEYALREQEIAARAAIISSNGFRVDRERAEARVAELKEARERIMAGLVEKHDFPTEGKQPWRQNKGKEAILSALKAGGVDPTKIRSWPRTKAGELSLGGKVLAEYTKGTPVEDLGQALAELMGQRSLAELALESTHKDGFVHPSITMLQKSGRWSTTKPGLTVWTARGEGAVEKEYFLPDNDDEVLLEIDLSNADARMVCAMSGDTKYAKRFEPGQDGHLLNAIAAWGYDVVMENEATKKKYRQMAKPLGHGWNYGGGPKKLSLESGVPLEDSETFCKGMNDEYKVLVGWQNQVRRFAMRFGYVINDWGRKMKVDKGREYTQAPALMGQSGTREMVCDILLDLPVHILRRVKAQIHDALVFSVPKDRFEPCRDYLIELATRSFKPKRGGLLIDFPCDAGPPGSNWYEAGH